MSALKYKVGDRVLIKSFDWFRNKDTNIFVACMMKYYGEVVTIKSIHKGFYRIKEDGGQYCWADEMFEGLVEEECPQDFIENYCKSCGTQRCDRTKEYLDGCPYYNAYMCEKQKNDMKRNACQKCVFAVYDDNPHCGLRGFRTSFNVERCSAENDTIPNGYELQEDGYFSWVEKKKEYPKTYEECCKVLGIDIRDLDVLDNMLDTSEIIYRKNLDRLLNSFRKLLICRDAYWKLYGEETGLGKPWEPDYTEESYEEGSPIKYVIYYTGTNITKGQKCTPCYILSFPTAEMRDAFYENFKELIEFVKELL